MVSIGERIRNLRKNKNVTQAELAWSAFSVHLPTPECSNCSPPYYMHRRRLLSITRKELRRARVSLSTK